MKISPTFLILGYSVLLCSCKIFKMDNPENSIRQFMINELREARVREKALLHKNGILVKSGVEMAVVDGVSIYKKDLDGIAAKIGADMQFSSASLESFRSSSNEDYLLYVCSEAIRIREVAER